MRYAMLTTLTLLLAMPAVAQEKATIRVVNYDGLKEAVLKQRGKVVVVDFWADFCLPCKRNLPHLVELHKKYADQGLAVITVSIDQLKLDPDVKGKLERFLTAKHADFNANLLLDVPIPEYEQKLRFKSVPTVYVFDRRGRWVQFTDDRYSIDRIDALVTQLVNERP